MLKTRVYTVMVVLPLFAAALFYLPSGGWALFLVPLMLFTSIFLLLIVGGCAFVMWRIYQDTAGWY